jgi:hypothetical protein
MVNGLAGLDAGNARFDGSLRLETFDANGAAPSSESL